MITLCCRSILLLYWLVLRFWWNLNSQILFTNSFIETFGYISPPSWAIFLPHPPPPPHKKLRNYIYYALRYFHFCQNFEIRIFAEILIIVAKFRKDSYFRAEIFRCRNTKYNIHLIHVFQGWGGGVCSKKIDRSYIF